MTTLAAEQQTRASLLDSQRRVLERIANGAPLREILETLVRLIEEQAHGMHCAVLLADTRGQRLSFAAAPSIPEDYKAGIDSFLRIAPEMGSCGTAAFLREPVYTRDTATDPLWKDCGDIAVRNGLRAIWSTPILSDDNAVVGTFAMYYGEPRLPSPEHIQLIDMATQMARVAIEAKGSEERMAEKIQALTRQKEDHLRLVIDTIPTMAWSVLPDGAVDFVNQPWLEYTGLSFGKALKEVNRTVHPEDLPGVMEKWLVDMAAGEPYEGEMRLRRADGKYRWFLNRTVPLRDEGGNIVKWYGTATDIEDRKRAEDALRESEEKFRQLAENAREVFWMTTPGMEELLYVSPAYADTWGRSLESLRRQPRSFMEAIHPEDREHVVGIIEGQRVQGFEVEYRVVRPDGSVRWIRDRGFPVRDQSGKVYRTAGVAEDITERRQAGDALRRSAADLQALSRRLVDLQESERKQLSRELHDRVGQSLTALKINIDILQTALASRGNAEVLARVADSAALLESTMDAIENVMSELRPPMLDDYGLASALDWHAKNFSKRTGIAVAVRASEPTVRPPPRVEIALFRIAQEALNNVAKHARAHRVEIALEHANDECVMSVEDDGIGFDGVEGASDKPKPGLGMVTMRERAQAVGGRFDVRALSARGTQLTVRVRY
jgi:PAS domain S-box-containing protein